jgi:hypothetical protein
MNSASPQVSEVSVRLLGDSHGLVIAFPAHTTKIFQALNPVFSSTLMKLKAMAEGEFGDHSINDEIAKLLLAYRQTATSKTIRGSSRKSAVVADTSARVFQLTLDEGTIQENEGFSSDGMATLKSRNQPEDDKFLDSE